MSKVVDIIFDITTLCEIFDDCAECPRYGDDCDGDRRADDGESTTDN